MILFALIVLAVIVGGYVYFVRKVKKSAPVVTSTVPAPAAAPVAPVVVDSDPTKQA